MEMRPARSTRRTRRALVAGLALAALAVGGGMQAAPALAAPQSELAAAHHEQVSFELEIGHRERTKAVPAMYCPAGMQLTRDQYAPDPSWNLTAGVQVIQEAGKENPYLRADISPLFNRQSERIGAGGYDSAISNRLGDAQTLTIVLHCTR